jgi:D-3-phosphoglycerate dehydrogenase
MEKDEFDKYSQIRSAAMKKPYKVVVTDYEYPDLDQERKVLSAIGVEFVAGQCKDEDAVIALAKDADALLNQYTKLTPKVMEALENCKIIIRYGIGVDNINGPAATIAGIMVCNVPTYGIHEVSDHVVGLFFSSIRKIPTMSEAVKKGRWNCNLARPIHRIHGKTLGLAGFGNIARMVAQKLAPWEMKVIGYDPFISESVFRSHGVEKASFEQLLKESDFVSVHVPHTEETYHMFSYERFKQMKRGAIFINTARGPLVDENGLYQALQEGWLAGAALDVMEKEPPAPDHPLLNLSNVIITPHMAWYSEESGVDLQRMAAEEVARVLSGAEPLWCLNREVKNRKQ